MYLPSTRNNSIFVADSDISEVITGQLTDDIIYCRNKQFLEKGKEIDDNFEMKPRMFSNPTSGGISVKRHPRVI